MAIKVNVVGSTYAGPMKDTRAEGYITFYTKSGWDRWKMAAEQVDQAVKEQKMTYDAAVKAYKDQIDSIDRETAALNKKLSDIALGKARAEWQNNLAKWKSEDKDRIEKYKAEVGEATKEAQHPSWSYSYGWSKSYGSGLGSSVRSAGGRDAGDESLDDIGDGTAAHMAVGDATSKTNDIAGAAAQLAQQYALQKAGTLDNTQYGSGVVAASTYRQQASKLAQLSDGALTEDQAAAELDKEIAKLPDGKVIAANIKYGEDAILKRAMGAGAGSKGGEGQHEGKSGGAWYGDIKLPKMDPISNTPIDTSSFDKASKAVEDQLKVVGIKPEVPVLEPIDIIDTARKTYAEKFGDVPRGTKLDLGGGVVGHFKNLMPFEISEGMKKTEQFFTMYINDSVQKAKAEALAAGRPFTVSDLNAATESGKATARNVLFGRAKLEKLPRSVLGEPTVGTPVGSEVLGDLGGESRRRLRDVPKLPPPFSPEIAGIGGGDLGPHVDGTERIIPNGPRPNLPPPVSPELQGFEGPLFRSGTYSLEDLKGSAINTPATESTPPNKIIDLGSEDYPNPSAEKIMQDRLAAEKAGLLSPKARVILDKLKDTSVPTAGKLTPPSIVKPGVDREKFFKERTGLPPKIEAAPVPTPVVPKVDVLGLADKKAKTEAVLAATKNVMDDQKLAAKDITKNAMGKYIATIYDENKGKGAKALPISDLTSTIIREYAGDATKQKKAIELLTQLAILDSTSNQIRS